MSIRQTSNLDITPSVDAFTWRGDGASPLDVLATTGTHAAMTTGYDLATAYRNIARTLLRTLHTVIAERDSERRRRYALLDELREARRRTSEHRRRSATKLQAGTREPASQPSTWGPA